MNTENQTSYPGKNEDKIWKDFVFPKNYNNPTPKEKYHLTIIGAGPAGLITAIAAAGLGAKVALIEKHAMGGDCLNVGCVPSKALLHKAKETFNENKKMQASDRFNNAMAWLRKVRSSIAEHDSVARYSEAGVDVFLGKPKFIDETKIDVDGVTINTKKAVICTGARASVIPFKGLEETGYLTNETIFDLKEQPKTLGIIGAGAIGCELAQAFSLLGTKVYLIDAAPTVLPREEPEAGKLLQKHLQKSGIETKLGIKIEEIKGSTEGKIIVLNENEELVVDHILCALGRKPNVEDLNLEGVAVKFDPIQGVEVNSKLQTTNPKIYAAGDICSKYKFTHSADAQARIVIQNALFKGRAKTDNLVIPWSTYTSPEVSHVGLTKAEAKSANIEFDTINIPFSELDRAKTDENTDSFAEILIGKKGKIIGATIVDPDAGELIAPIALAMSNGLSISEFSKTVLPYPTRSEYLRRAADAYNRKKLTPFVSNLFKLWFKFT